MFWVPFLIMMDMEMARFFMTIQIAINIPDQDVVQLNQDLIGVLGTNELGMTTRFT